MKKTFVKFAALTGLATALLVGTAANTTAEGDTTAGGLWPYSSGISTPAGGLWPY